MITNNDKVYFDTDCLSAFMLVDEMGIIFQIFKNNIVLPNGVYEELCKVSCFKPRINNYISNGVITVKQMGITSNEMKIFKKIKYKDSHYKEFGVGEAEVISYAVCNSKTMASNNLSDVARYVDEYELVNYTIPDIIDLILENKIKTKEEIELLWIKFLDRNLKLPFTTYQEYLNYKKYGKFKYDKTCQKDFIT